MGMRVIGCDDKNITAGECMFTVAGMQHCRWYPKLSKCYSLCYNYNETSCGSANCQWDSSLNVCGNLPAQCEDQPVQYCGGDCGLTGGTTCVACNSAKTLSSCMDIRNCNWNGTDCGKPDPRCHNLDETKCNATPECWFNGGSCQLPDKGTPWCGIGNSKTTKCIEWEDSSPEMCSELSLSKCVWKPDCTWGRSNTCVPKTRSVNSKVACGDHPGCWETSSDICTSQAIGCKNLTKETCGRDPDCVWEEDDVCRMFDGCRGLSSEESCLSKGCLPITGSSSGTFFGCGYNETQTCPSVGGGCEGEDCEGRILAEYGLKATIGVVQPGFSKGESIYNVLTDSPMRVNNKGDICYNCGFCEPGYAVDVRAAVVCDKPGLPTSFSRPMCFAVSASDDTNSCFLITCYMKMQWFIIGVAGLIVVCILYGATKKKKKKSNNRHNNDHYHLQEIGKK
eukprot:TRINITY_DN16963_c0_g1_i1.p1 TRINITY_DN16963_c0_g1~~TRINITY_DN16963_c0_g1_i1.p1  ORF type:complete len:451 (+),score=84.22 TRINITY_DN16963_c0_g1_i1:56-1408(+)